MAREKEISLVNLIYHNEQVAWRNLSEQHKGYRTALWRILSDNMYSVGDFYVPAEELFFNTTAVADQVLENIINSYNFKEPKRINVIQPRYKDKEKGTELMEMEEYLKGIEEYYLFYVEKDEFRVVVTEKEKEFCIAIF